LNKRVPARGSLGQELEADLTITALDNCANVVIADTIPEGSSLVKSDPPAKVTGKSLVWTVDTMDKGSTLNLKVWYRADKEGVLVNCATMAALPRGCAGTVIGSAKLVVACQLPASVNVGSAFTKTIEVKNTGNAPATDVVVTDTLSGGISAEGQNLTFKVGELAPGEAKQIKLALKATKRGDAGNAVVAKAGNAAQANSQCAMVVNQPGLDIAKTGTKEQFLGRTASYEIVVSNTGDTDLRNVNVTDTAPAATKIVSAEGARISGNTATWTLATLKAGAKENLKVALTSMTPGEHCNGVAVKSAEGLSDTAQACTTWKGVPAILIEVVDNPDPISVGDSTTYTIRVTNQGTADDKNVKIVANFDKEINPVSAEGSTKATVDGKQVSCVPVGVLAPKQSVQWTINAKGASTGDHRLKVLLTSDMLTAPVTEEESTHVY
jgi:uncharacterized repeat protein (TIGR01451 family)